MSVDNEQECYLAFMDLILAEENHEKALIKADRLLNAFLRYGDHTDPLFETNILLLYIALTTEKKPRFLEKVEKPHDVQEKNMMCSLLKSELN